MPARPIIKMLAPLVGLVFLLGAAAPAVTAYTCPVGMHVECATVPARCDVTQRSAMAATSPASMMFCCDQVATPVTAPRVLQHDSRNLLGAGPALAPATLSPSSLIAASRLLPQPLASLDLRLTSPIHLLTRSLLI